MRALLLALALALALALNAAPAAAQMPDPAPPGFWAEFFAAAKAAGWFGTLAFMLLWWLERGERKEMQALIMGEKGVPGLLEKCLTALHDGKDAINQLRAALKGPQA
jgi:hypothetical protein